MVTAIREPDYLESETCDWWIESEDCRCENSPAGYIGDMYYACEEHTDDYCDWLESG